MRKTPVLALLIALIIIALGTIAIKSDNLKLWISTDKALTAANIIQQKANKAEPNSLHEIQSMLNYLEEHIQSTAGNTPQALRRQQDIERKLRQAQEELKPLTFKKAENSLALNHTILRIEMIIEQVELNKQKTKINIKN